MRTAPADRDELQASFRRVLDGIHDGRVTLCPTGLGFDGAVCAALSRLALAPEHPVTLQRAARVALERQLNSGSGLFAVP